jgi:hypothetical protein
VSTASFATELAPLVTGPRGVSETFGWSVVVVAEELAGVATVEPAVEAAEALPPPPLL